MFSQLIDKLTGKDDVERVMAKNDMKLLMEHLKARKLYVARRPKRYLDAANFTQDQLMELIESEANDLSGDQFEPWILEVDGKNRLPVFSSQKTMEAFSSKVSQSLNKVFSLGAVEFLIEDVMKWPDVEVIDLNYCSPGSIEITIHRPSQAS